ncbi:DgyrCDS123 [Dimorphilus gyrociliatus]|uniref:DgyrCDS123 n=1 Tax=Dimorphilus gyrociliatus TaxID=2664684 RepID=A0A7I8V6E5_9ANNE|nr:DgyrCDS123 [Dimorphilus gyrociliatus]
MFLRRGLLFLFIIYCSGIRFADSNNVFNSIWRFTNNKLEKNKPDPNKCCTPLIWQADFIQTEGLAIDYGRTSSSQANGIVYMNSTQQKFAVNASITLNGDKDGEIHFLLLDYKNGVGFSVLNGKCFKLQITETWPGNCLPPTTKLIKSTKIGLGKNLLKGQIWKSTVSTYTSEERVTIITAKDGSNCVPVSVTMYGSELTTKDGRIF